MITEVVGAELSYCSQLKGLFPNCGIVLQKMATSMLETKMVATMETLIQEMATEARTATEILVT